MEVVKAEACISYKCDCPYCGETYFSEYKSDWDLFANMDCSIIIKCDECSRKFQIEELS